MLEHVEIDRSTSRGRSVMAGALVALGVLIGMLAILAPGAKAQSTGPDGPERVFALTTKDKLVRFNGDNPRQVNSKNIKGLGRNGSLVGIDFRPGGDPAVKNSVDGKLYGVGAGGYIYTINIKTAVATRASRIKADFDGDGDLEPVTLRGKRFGIDFNPTVDRLRIVSDADQNLRVNVDTGVLADFDENPNNGTQPDRPLKYAANDPNTGQDPRVAGVAYRNSRPAAFGSDNTELYDIDARTDDLSEQDPPNNGVLNTVGPLGVDTTRLIGFDIVTRGASPSGDRGYAVLKPVNSAADSRFYKINLNTGDVTNIGLIGGGNANVEGLAIPIGQM